MRNPYFPSTFPADSVSIPSAPPASDAPNPPYLVADAYFEPCSPERLAKPTSSQAIGPGPRTMEDVVGAAILRAATAHQMLEDIVGEARFTFVFEHAEAMYKLGLTMAEVGRPNRRK